MQPTVLQKLLLGFSSAAGVLANPKREDLVAVLGETIGIHVVRSMRDRMLETTEGREVLRMRPILPSLMSLEHLKNSSKKSFGYHHYQFFSRNNITPDTRTPVQYVTDCELAYVIQRYRELHDILHTLTGMDVTVEEEIALKIFEYIQTGHPMTIFGGLFGPLALNNSGKKILFSEYLPWAIHSARGAKYYMAYDFEKLFGLDIQIVREQMNIIPFKRIEYF